jgi:hypothetical protein
VSYPDATAKNDTRGIAPVMFHSRLYWPICPATSNPDVDLLLSGTQVPMQVGRCPYLRLSNTHAIANRDSTARVHLVIDHKVEMGMAAQLGAPLLRSRPRPADLDRPER